MSWQLLILLHTFLMALSVLSMRAVARKPVATNASFVMGATQSLFLFIGTVILIPILGPLELSKFQDYFWWFMAGGVASTLGNAALYKILTFLDAAISSILSTIYVFFVIIFAAIILNEKLSLQQGLGSLFLLAAIIYGTLIARHRDIKKRGHRAWAWGLGFALIGGIIIGAGVVNEKHLINNMNAPTFLTIAFGCQLIFTTAAAIIFQPRKFVILKDTAILKLNAVNGLIRTLAGVFMVLAQIRSNNVALMTVVSNFKLIIVIVLGAILLKEHQKLGQKMVAATIASIGLIIIFWK